MKVAIHQPDLLPYSGFWFKMATSDLFVLAEHDQFQKHGYQRRVTMREKWCSHQLVGKPALVPITEVEVQPGWQSNLSNIIRGRYTGAKFWKPADWRCLIRLKQAPGIPLLRSTQV
ncbi:MAG: WbqC family protein [Marmoricola sp.]